MKSIVAAVWCDTIAFHTATFTIEGRLAKTNEAVTYTAAYDIPHPELTDLTSAKRPAVVVTTEDGKVTEIRL